MTAREEREFCHMWVEGIDAGSPGAFTSTLEAHHAIWDASMCDSLASEMHESRTEANTQFSYYGTW